MEEKSSMRGCKVSDLLIFAILLLSNGVYGQEDKIIREKYLSDLKDIIIDQRIQKNTRRVTLQDSTWEEWLKRSGELPPDFSKMKSNPFLPNPLLYEKDGMEVEITDEKQWRNKRRWIQTQYKYWISGDFPSVPNNLRSEILLDSISNGVRIQKIRLSFGPSHKAKLHIELWIPDGNERFPVFLTQFTHKDWGRLALRRGYAVCMYAANDDWDDTQSYQNIYPEYDFSCLMRRAWGASRVVDYLLTRREVNKDQIAITGHSRNGKQSLWAAAFDERISAVVSSSSSTGGDAPWRFGDPQYASETLDLVTAANVHWFHPRLRFFFGNEDKLPIDQNSLASLIAPRPLLFHYSVTERGLNAWANEQNYYSVKKVYDFLGATDRIGVYTRKGEHAVAARDVEFTLDFLDKHFGRNNLEWNNRLFYNYDFDEWLSKRRGMEDEAEKLNYIELTNGIKKLKDFEKQKEVIKYNINWFLGEEPPKERPEMIDVAAVSRYDWIESVIGHSEPANGVSFYYGPYTAFGDHLPVRIYFPKNKQGEIENKRYPIILYLHQYAHSTGYLKGYNKRGGMPSNHLLFEKLLSNGYAVAVFDMFGYGTRMEEAVNFYNRHPSWSKMGKMVSDVQSVLDGLEKIDRVNSDKVFVLGNTLGGIVGAYTAALDSRINALATVASFTPYRKSSEKYESIRTMSHLHGLIPRLGLFCEQPEKTPVDFSEIISCIAPRPVLVIAPTLDRYTDNDALTKSLEISRSVYQLYGNEANLKLFQPKEINRLSGAALSKAIEFFNNCK